MRPVKSIQFSYAASADLRSLFEDFPLMCNDAIRIAIEQKPKSRFVRLGHPEEAVKGNPEGRRQRAILRAEGWKLIPAISRRFNRAGFRL